MILDKVVNGQGCTDQVRIGAVGNAGSAHVLRMVLPTAPPGVRPFEGDFAAKVGIRLKDAHTRVWTALAQG